MRTRIISKALAAAATLVPLSALGAPVDVTPDKIWHSERLHFTFHGSEFRLCHTAQGWEVTTLGANWGDFIDVRPHSIITSLKIAATGNEVGLGFEDNELILKYHDGRNDGRRLDADGCLPILSSQSYTASFSVTNKNPHLALFADFIEREIRSGHLEVASALLKMPYSVDKEIYAALEGISPASSRDEILAAANKVKALVFGATQDEELAVQSYMYVSTLQPKEVRYEVDPFGLPHLIETISILGDEPTTENPIFTAVADRLSKLSTSDLAQLNDAVNKFRFQGDEEKLMEFIDLFYRFAPWAKNDEITNVVGYGLSLGLDQSQYMQFQQYSGEVTLAY